MFKAFDMLTSQNRLISNPFAITTKGDSHRATEAKVTNSFSPTKPSK